MLIPAGSSPSLTSSYVCDPKRNWHKREETRFETEGRQVFLFLRGVILPFEKRNKRCLELDEQVRVGLLCGGEKIRMVFKEASTG